MPLIGVWKIYYIVECGLSSALRFLFIFGSQTTQNVRKIFLHFSDIRNNVWKFFLDPNSRHKWVKRIVNKFFSLVQIPSILHKFNSVVFQVSIGKSKALLFRKLWPMDFFFQGFLIQASLSYHKIASNFFS